MTKKELVQELEKYDDNQYVYIRMHKDDAFLGPKFQIIIQGITDTEPWHNGKEDRSNYLIGFDCHVENRILKREER